MQIAILLYDRFTALDAVGPYEVLGRLPGAELTFVATEPGPVRTDRARSAMTADAALREYPHPDIVVVPGGYGTRDCSTTRRSLGWLREAHATHARGRRRCAPARCCSAAAGDPRRASRPRRTGSARDELGRPGRRAGRRPRGRARQDHHRRRRVVGHRHGPAPRRARIAGDDVAQAIQLGIEYDPQPPFDAGSPETAPDEIVALVRGLGVQNA